MVTFHETHPPMLNPSLQILHRSIYGATLQRMGGLFELPLIVSSTSSWWIQPRAAMLWAFFLAQRCCNVLWPSRIMRRLPQLIFHRENQDA
ncbi:MAG: hypothetical protein RIS44_310 [Pseudomonadota bacterium]|jgi:hypothetical protein